MKSDFFKRFRFSELRKDKWRSSVGDLNYMESYWLKVRGLVYLAMIAVKFTVLLPVTTIRFLVNFVKLLVEFDRLHFSPKRKIHCGRDCVIDLQTWIVNGQNVTIGDFVKISAFSSVMAGNLSTIKIGTNTIIGPGVLIVSFNHGIEINEVPIRYQKWQDLAENSIIIGEDVWIGGNAIILPGTTIGKGSIIGAGAIVKGAIMSETITYSVNGQIRTVQRK